MGSGSDDAKAIALEALGNLAFCPANRSALHAASALKQRAVRCALAAPGTVKHIVRAAAIRALAILGACVRCLLGVSSHSCWPQGDGATAV